MLPRAVDILVNLEVAICSSWNYIAVDRDVLSVHTDITTGRDCVRLGDDSLKYTLDNLKRRSVVRLRSVLTFVDMTRDHEVAADSDRTVKYFTRHYWPPIFPRLIGTLKIDLRSLNIRFVAARC